jgi:hypothetical protein
MLFRRKVKRHGPPKGFGESEANKGPGNGMPPHPQSSGWHPICMALISIEASLLYSSLSILAVGGAASVIGFRVGRSSRLLTSDSSWLIVSDPGGSPIVQLPWTDLVGNTDKFQEVLRLHLAQRVLLVRKQISDPETLTAASAELFEKALGLFEKISESIFSDASITKVGEMLDSLRSRILNEPGSLGAQVVTLAGAATVVSVVGIFAALAGLAACLLRMRESWSVGEKADYLIEIGKSQPHIRFRTACLLARQQLSSGRLHGSSFYQYRRDLQNSRNEWFRLFALDLSFARKEGDVDRCAGHLYFACLALYVDYFLCEAVGRSAEFRLGLSDDLPEFIRAGERLREVSAGQKGWRKQEASRVERSISEWTKGLRFMSDMIDVTSKIQPAAKPAYVIEMKTKITQSQLYRKLSGLKKSRSHRDAA